MTAEEIAVELRATGERIEALDNRLSVVEKDQRALSDLTTSVRVLASDQGHLKDDVGEIKSDVKSLMAKPAKRWDGLVDKVLFAMAGAFIAWLAAGMPGA